MVSSCCICAKENNPLEPQRSFHRIPANEEMKNKWFDVIGRIVSYKGARVCSDHFTKDDYHDIHPYTRIKRLKNTAVPSIILQKKEKKKRRVFQFQKTAINSYNNSEILSQNEIDVALCNSENHEDNASNDISEIKESSENANNQLVLAQDINEELIIFLNSEKEINATCIDNQIKVDANFENINDISRERKFPLPDLRNSEMRKVSLNFSKHNKICFTKADFSSDEKWTAFLKCVAYRKRKDRILLRKNKCLQKKLLIFQDMLQDLLKKV